jgi:hypothetical protein
MEVKVLAHSALKRIADVERAIAIVNELQGDFELHLERVDWLPNGSKEVDPANVARQVRKKFPTDHAVTIVRPRLNGDTFDYPSKGLNIVSIADWDKDFAPPPLKIYIVYQFAYALSAFVASLPYPQLKRLMHKRPRGCIFDTTKDRAEFRLGLVAAYFCGECEASLSEWGATDRQLESLSRILSYVRDFAIRKPRHIPTSVFIGHGRCKDWEQVRDHLISLGVEVDEFNVYPTPSILTVDRLTQMLDRACLAILVMAAEDRQADGSLHPRLNVVHEIGLFQGRLGFQKSIIVKEKRAGKFSNIDGLTYIAYSKGKIAGAFPEIDRALVRERVIPPATIVIPSSKSRSQLRA